MRPALKRARTKCIMQKELLSFDMHPLAPPPSRPERITRGAKFRRMFPVRFTKNKVRSCQVPVGDTTVSNCHAAKRERFVVKLLVTFRLAATLRNVVRRHVSSELRRLSPEFGTSISQHLRYRTLIILDTDSIRFSFSLFFLLHFVKFSNEQFHRIWFEGTIIGYFLP